MFDSLADCISLIVCPLVRPTSRRRIVLVNPVQSLPDKRKDKEQKKNWGEQDECRLFFVLAIKLINANKETNNLFGFLVFFLFLALDDPASLCQHNL